VTKFIMVTILVAISSYGASEPDPLNAREAAIKLISDQGLREARNVIERMLSASPPISSPYELSYLAELMQLTGDPRAKETYRKAIGKDTDPAIELLFGEYERNFRGPMQPMMGEAEEHFFAAKRGLACVENGGGPGRSAAVRNQLARSIATLYERDGLPLYSWISKEKLPCGIKGPGISLFLSTGVRGGEGITDLDVDSDIRSLTAAAAYSQSLRVSFGPLSTNLLEHFLRTVTPFENRNRLRARYRGARLDLFFNDHRAGNAAITNPILRDPTPLANRDLVLYNALRLNEFGVSVERPFQLSQSVDADISFTYSKIYRTGLVDYNPDALENIDQVVVKGVLSRFVGPDKVNGEFTFVDQSITPEHTSFNSRGRQIYAGTFRYQVYRVSSGGYSRFFQGTRGLEFYGGVMHDSENFGYALPAIVNQQDYFAGATVHALGRLVDLSIQPTWFMFTVPSDASRNSRQYRTAAFGMLRLVDEERKGPDLPPDWHGLRLGFVHLTIPVQSDVPERGLSVFANQKVGAELSAKWFTTERGGTTFLGSARYDVQQFTQLNRTFSLFTLGVTMGF
jgi:hypothetical protein